MQKSQHLWKLYSIFWSLYGHYAWDDQHEQARVSDPPERIVEIVQNRCIKPGERILDAGCGTGNYSIALAKAGFHVIGTDFAAGMLTKAREKIDLALSENVSFQQVDLNAPLDFPKGYFDQIISISVLQAVAHPDFTLSELYRVLKPRGTIVLSLPKENSDILSQSLNELIKHRIRHLERRTPRKIMLVVLKCLGDRLHHVPRWTVPQTQVMLSAMGFEMISIEEGRQILAVAEKH
jgi:2-polyprenyl-3-methyl-5-hydroxy-6-metoxy-1,4-benzoquinol methylase